MTPSAWLAEYHAGRYLRPVLEEELQKRQDGLAANLWTTDALVRVRAIPDNNWRRRIRHLIFDTLLEQHIWSGIVTANLDEVGISVAVSGKRTASGSRSYWLTGRQRVRGSVKRGRKTIPTNYYVPWSVF